MTMHVSSLDKLFSRKELHQAEREKFEEVTGAQYGLVFGIALGLTAWGWDAYELWRASSEFFWLKLILVAIVLIPLTTLTGLIVGRIHGSNFRRLIVWVLAGSIIGPLGLLISTLVLSAVIALFDPAIRGVTIYPLSQGLQERVVLIAIFGAVAAPLVTGLQNLTTGWAWERSSSDNRLSFSGWRLLWACAPVALGLGALYDGSLNAQVRAPVQLSSHLIELRLTTPPDADINKMDTFTLLDYLITSRWEKDFTPHYIQRITDLDSRTLRSAFVDVEFDNGFIWRCQSVRNGDGISDCVDLKQQYQDWMRQFITTGIVQCGDCMVTITPSAQIWHTQNARNLGEPRNISLAHHAGGVIVVTAALDSGQVECRFVGANPASIRDCVKR